MRQPSVIGSWRPNSIPSKVTNVGGASHETIICETVFKQNAIQSNNCLTTKENCYVKDSTVTEVTLLATTLSKSGLDKKQHLAWKDDEPKVTKQDVETNFDVRRQATVEEDANFQQSKNLQNKNYTFRTNVC